MTHGGARFVEFVNLRLVAVYSQDDNLLAETQGRTGRTDPKDAAQYVQVSHRAAGMHIFRPVPELTSRLIRAGHVHARGAVRRQQQLRADPADLGPRGRGEALLGRNAQARVPGLGSRGGWRGRIRLQAEWNQGVVRLAAHSALCFLCPDVPEPDLDSRPGPLCGSEAALRSG
eukprot:1238139-Rhodomonas_salina.3